MNICKEILKSLETGNPDAIDRGISKDKYIQHNLMFPDGRETLLGALPMLVENGTKVNTIRVFEDGDYVVCHSEYCLFGKNQVGFDVFRREKGLIVEHWDNLQDLVENTENGHTMIDGEAEIRDLEKTETNKKVIDNLITDVFLNSQFHKLPDYISNTIYIQHNPHIGNGLEGLQRASGYLARFKYMKLFKILGQGNFVISMSEVMFDGKETTIYDLFRLMDGKCVEHWDVIEITLPRSEWKNANGKF